MRSEKRRVGKVGRSLCDWSSDVCSSDLHDRMISTDVEHAVAAQEIQIRLIIHVVEIRALGAGIDFVETDDALRLHQRSVQMFFVQVVILAQARSNEIGKASCRESGEITV